MIQELVEFGKRVTKGKSMAFKEEPFVIDLVINEDGEFLRFIVGDKRTIETEVITAKKGKARFLLDKCDEVLGYSEGSEKKHKLFLDKLGLYRGLPALEPVFKFYDANNEKGVNKAVAAFDELDKKVKAENLTFMVGTTRLLETDEIRSAIIKKFEENEKQASNGKICSICGTSNSPVLDEPHGYLRFKKRFLKKDGSLGIISMGHPTGQNTLVSYNEKVFESYNLTGNLNSSICRECAKNYVAALNFLEAEGYPKDKFFQYRHRVDISDTTIVLFWTRKEVDDFDPFDVIELPDVSNVKQLLDSAWKGNYTIGSVIDTNMFYSITLTPSARTIVRDWTAMSLNEYKKNLAEWFSDIEMVDNDGKLTYSPLRWLINATQRDKRQGEKSKSDLNSKTRIGTILWNAAIKGHSYKIPLEVIQYVLNRIWKKDDFSKERASLIKLVINRNTNKHMKSTLDEANTSLAYLCGRLFAVIESMQWKAMGNVNSGVKERYFAAVASQPSILGTLLTKNVPIYQHKIGGYLAKELNEIAGKISEVGSFPQRFSTIEQGEFALGYYFQRNHKKETTESNN